MVALLYQTSAHRLAIRLRRIALLVCLFLIVTTLPASLESAPVTPPAAPAYLICRDALLDPAIERSPPDSPWLALRNQVRFAEQTIHLLEDDDGDADGSVDVDSFGQTFSVPPTTAQIIGSLRYRIAPSALGPNDTVTVALRVPDNPLPAGLVFSVNLPLSGRADGIWRDFAWSLIDAEAVARLVELGSAQFVVTMRGVPDSAALSVFFDQIEAQICAPETVRLSGRVTQLNRSTPNLGDAQILLVRHDATGSSVIATTGVTPTDEGFRYQFDAPPLASGASYQIWFVNQPLTATRDDRRVGALAGPVVSAASAGQAITNLDLELSSVELVMPPANALLVLNDDTPVRFQITPRPIAGEEYQICLYDPAVIIPETGQPPQVCSPRLTADEPFFDLLPADFGSLPLRYGYPYRWYAIVHDARGTAAHPAYSVSFYERAVTFALAPPTLPVAPTTDEGRPPGAAPAGWTVLIYVAADNALGDSNRMSVVAQPGYELNRLRSLAAAYPNISLVTFYDGYGRAGSEICAIRGSAVDCRRQPEVNSADPDTLRNFVTYGLTEFPASRVMLVLVGPFHPVFGFGSDEALDTPTAMSVTALGEALARATADANRTIDVALTQAPLTANLAVAQALAPAARYLVAPPGQIWRAAWLHRVLSRLTASDGSNPRAVATAIPSLYVDAARADGVLREYAMTALDLTRVTAALTARNQLAVELRQVLNERNAVFSPLLASIRARSASYDTSGNGLVNAMRDPAGERQPAPEDAFIDLGDFAAYLAADPALQASELIALRTASQSLSAALGGTNPLVIAARRQEAGGVGIPTLPTGAGLAEFFPHPSFFGAQPALVERLLYRGQADGWSNLLRLYLSGKRMTGVGGVTDAPPGGISFPLVTGMPIAYDRYLPIVFRDGENR